jgi:OmpA-OmpF porin, OOP family
MYPRTRAALFALVVAGAAFPTEQAHAQLGRIRDRVRAEAEAQIGRRPAKQPAEQPAAPAQAAAAGSTAAAPTAFVNFDFVPGERVLFAEDFTRDAVGDFPRRLELVEGNGEVAELAGRRYLHAPGDLTFAVPLPEVLPERFTVEIEYLAPANSRAELYLSEGGEAAYDRGGKARVSFITGPDIRTEAGLDLAVSRSTTTRVTGLVAGTLFPLRVMADGRYVKVYLGGTRVANAPGFDVGRSRQIVMRILGASLGGSEGAYIAGIRVAAGGRDLYDALLADGRVAVQGILFDTGSDRIRPESAPVLQQIGDLLRKHAGLRLRVEGHTDDVGADDANLALSHRRAAAVRQYLVERFSIDASRLEGQGFGETRPAVPNTTPEAREQNRRVELVRL